ncbi:hypothetical protein [Nonomuraea sp. NPDC050691]
MAASLLAAVPITQAIADPDPEAAKTGPATPAVTTFLGKKIRTRRFGRR